MKILQVKFSVIFVMILTVTIILYYSRRVQWGNWSSSVDTFSVPFRKGNTSYPQMNHPKNLPSQKERICNGTLVTSTITQVNRNVFVIAAYFHASENKIRVVGIKKRAQEEDFQCIFCCSDGTLPSMKAEVVVHPDHFDFPYGHTDLLCDLPPGNCNPVYVSVNDDSKKIEPLQFLEIKKLEAEPKNSDNKFTVCISPMFNNYDKVLQFVQHTEMYKILGAQKMVLYLTDCSSRMEKVLKYYNETGFLELIPWPITSHLTPSSGWKFPDHPGDIHYFGQIPALNDCVFRNMYKTQYVAINDLDEIIFPVEHNNWSHLMEHLAEKHPESGAFLIRSHVFPNNAIDDHNTFKVKEWETIKGGNDLNILQHIYREPDRSWVFNPVKMIVIPQFITHVSIHAVLGFTLNKQSVALNNDIVRLCHFRKPEQPELTIPDLIRDISFWKYNVSLIKRVNEVLEESGMLIHK